MKCLKCLLQGKALSRNTAQTFGFYCPNYVLNDKHRQILKSVYIITSRDTYDSVGLSIIIFDYFMLRYLQCFQPLEDGVV